MEFGPSDSPEDVVFDPNELAAILSVGQQLVLDIPRRRCTRPGVYYSESGPYDGFDGINRERTLIMAALACPEAENMDNAQDGPAAQVVKIFGELLDVSISVPDVVKGASEFEQAHARGAKTVRHGIGQIVAQNHNRLYELALMDDRPDISGPARRLLMHGEITIENILPGELPKSLPFVKEVMEYESVLRTPYDMGGRWASLVRQTVRSGDTEAMDVLLETLQEFNPSEEMLDNIMYHVAPGIAYAETKTVSDVRVIAQLSELLFSLKRTEPGHRWKQDASSLLGQFSHSTSPLALMVKSELVSKAQDKPDILDGFLYESYGIDSHTLESAWKDALGDHYAANIESYRRQNIRMITELETAHPGSALYLMQEYRICNFARYPYQVLARQYLDAINTPGEPVDERPLTNKWYVADYDHSKAFNNLAVNMEQFASYIWAAGQNVEIHEVGDTDTIIQSILDTTRKIGIALLTAHSEGKRATLSRYAALDQNEIIQNRRFGCLERLAGQFSLNAMGIMDTCHTGEVGNLGDTIADSLGIEVTAPTTRTALIGFTNVTSRANMSPTVAVRLRPIYQDPVSRHITPLNAGAPA